MKIGDRVRIDCPYSERNGKEATIVEIKISPNWKGVHKAHGVNDAVSYRLDVDGFGRINERGNYIGYPRHMLKPIQPLGSWEEISRMIGTDIRRERETRIEA